MEVEVLGVVADLEGFSDVLLFRRPGHLALNRLVPRLDRRNVVLEVLLGRGLLGGEDGTVLFLGADRGVLLDDGVHLLFRVVGHVDPGTAGGRSPTIGVVVVASSIGLNGGSVVDGELGVVHLELQDGYDLAHGVDGGPNLRSLFNSLNEQSPGFFLVLHPAISLDL